MATITISFNRVCTGGGHLHVNVSKDGGPSREVFFETDELRDPVNDGTLRDAVLFLLKLRFQGMTRAQIRSDLQAGIVMVI